VIDSFYYISLGSQLN